MRLSLLPSTAPAPKHMKSTSMLGRFNEAIKRTTVLRTLPNVDSCLRLIRSLAVEKPRKPA
ncbi:transposase-like protein [Rhizobium sp. BK060]|nr:transposase-like protein [Rhizobium sp. BK060]